MGAKVGAIPSAVGGHDLKLSHVGTVFPTTPENVARWREWLRYVHADQIWVWGLFCFLGMFLNVNLATAIIPTEPICRGSPPARIRPSTCGGSGRGSGS